MRRLSALFVFLFLISCSEYIDKPKNLLDKSIMSEIMADLAINDQVTNTFQDKNLESGTRYILKSHNVKADDFVESYKYYVATGKMSKIVDNAQEILLEKDPKAKGFVESKSKPDTTAPTLVR
ncbi:hypothetical protein CHRY9390_01231 [Chryseobacterium aquaeductus]|uniref:DUF4296 domain-containing protein n=1 Tax=Chryseobacterium aquaeductus TaxID=2675056 RepID=A0A9N8MFF0_9FLAO|nr:DUF4296 domain-containing protein [Chryseobacterium aquaeductus]CAA7330560.1 hypothetical protein CHRY9390_01231 [Chryseobacterium potabilaquae]CAD7804490.1 hypothetical protein CHRY9390_01231 [Chryseobacterium aquaeductus]